MTRSISFHLPQFHPIPENDEWWGKGFTEWRNVVKARPRFTGHYQPHVPADHGYYDLRVPEVREEQASLASRYGVSGFCYYHYWFNGHRLLHAPVDDILASGRPDFPFMLCWANENWTRRWDGADQQILISQKYGRDDDIAHIQHLAPVFADARYIRQDGKPVFLVYRASQLPHPRATLDTWREEISRLGMGELFLCRVEAAHGPDRGDPRELGFDAAVEFQPDWLDLPPKIQPSFVGRVARRLLRPDSGYRGNQVYSYDELVQRALAKAPVAYRRFRCVTPSWDNTARRASNATIFRGSTPDKFEGWLDKTLTGIKRPEDRDFVFVNAWNEWAEGAHLEPDERWGHGYLEAHRRCMERHSARRLDLSDSGTVQISGAVARTSS